VLVFQTVMMNLSWDINYDIGCSLVKDGSNLMMVPWLFGLSITSLLVILLLHIAI
jgi:hypothetical protein